jgi:hypothetical protein
MIPFSDNSKGGICPKPVELPGFPNSPSPVSGKTSPRKSDMQQEFENQGNPKGKKSEIQK